MDSKSFIFPLLTDPESGDSLVLNEKENCLVSTRSGRKFRIVNGIPEFVNSAEIETGNTDLHRKHNSVFDYRKHYKADAQIFDYSEKSEPSSSRSELKRTRETISREISNDYKIILDAGCGKGWVAETMVKTGKKVISMDLSETNPLKVLNKTDHPDHAALIADIYNIPLKDNSVDCIVLSQVLEHLADPAKAVECLLHILRPGGKLIITVPNNEKIEYYLCVHCNKPTPRNAHLHSFNIKNIVTYIPDRDYQYDIKTFSNKYINRLRLNTILSAFPFFLWKLTDNFFNAVLGKPERMMITVIKSRGKDHD